MESTQTEEALLPVPNGNPTHDRSDIEALKASVDLPAFIEAHGVPLQKTGANWKGRCPFHDDDSPSLSVNPREQLWRCFGCGKAGDVFSFLQHKEGMAFPQALAYLRGQSNLPLKTPDIESEEQPATLEHEDQLPGGYTRPQLLGRVADFYRHRLAESKAARAYLRRRGLDVPDLAESFRLGFSDGESLLRTLPESGDLRDAMVRLGIVTDTGREFFAGSVVVPLEHPDHGMVALYGRKIGAEAKVPHLFLRGPQRGVLNWQALNSARAVFVAESVFDALSLWVAGVRDVTCIFGTKGLHRDLSELLGRFAIEEVRLCLDSDGPGREATLRVARELARRGIRCVQVALPDDCDPNEVLVAQGATSLRACAQDLRHVELEDATVVAPAADRPAVEDTAKGFVMQFSDLAYNVTPIGPFTGKLLAIVQPGRGARSFSDKGDLYTHRFRNNVASQVLRHFEISREEAERHMMAVLGQAEAWVTAQAQAKAAASQQLKAAPPMEASAQEEALAMLRRPDLVAAILQDMETLGYTGENNGKLLAYLVGLSRKLEQPMSAIIRSQSGAGKSAMAELVENMCPPEEVVAFARLTTNSLQYEEKDYLKRKLLIIEERTGAEQADYSIRVLQSKGKLTLASVCKDPTTGRMFTEHFEVEGPIAYLETTTSATINYENRTRCFEIHLDESELQTRRIQERQRAARMEGTRNGRSTDSLLRRHHNMQRLLEPVIVYLPYASLLTFPTRWLRTRRDNQRFLCLIEAVAFLHQHQREGGTEEVDGQPVRFIRATLDDYRLAYNLAREVLDITLHELSRDGSSLWAAVRAMVDRRVADKKPAYFTRRELRAFSDWQDHRLRDALAELVEMEYLDKIGGSQGKTYHYRLNDEPGAEQVSLRELLTPEQLEAKMRGSGLLS